MKVAVIAAFLGLWCWAYDALNTYTSDPVRTIRLTSPADLFPWIINPWTAAIYILGGAIFPVAPFFYLRSWRGITHVIACIATAAILSFGVYWLWPVSMVRPNFRGTTLGERLMIWVFSVDKPGNCFPSSHVYFAVLGALLITAADASQRARWCWWAFAVAVCLTTVTSGQHYFIDVPGGVAVALAGYAVGTQLTGRPPR